MKNQDLPNKISIFPLTNFIIFPGSDVPLNIFEPRYIKMVDECMRGNRLIGIIQPKKTGDLKKPDLYNIGCAGKITSFNETEDGRILVILSGICRFKVNSEIKTDKLYRESKVNYENFSRDMSGNTNEINFSDLNIIMDNMKKFFKKQGYIVNLKDLEKKGIYLTTATAASTYYIGFNMLDSIVGGSSKRSKLLRQAITIAIDYDEYISIFANGRGILAQSPIPPGIFGYQDGKKNYMKTIFKKKN